MQTELPFKWKLFRILNYFHIGSVMGIVIFIWDSRNEIDFTDSEVLSVFTIVMLSFFFLLLNSYINLLNLKKHYPGRSPGNKLQKFSLFLLLFSVIFVLVLAIMTAIIFLDALMMSQHSDWDIRSIGLMISLTMLCLTAVPIFEKQFILCNLIRRNYHSGIDPLTGTADRP